ncbi:MAG: hypothetical protein MZW92_42250 [Comamonadaceae bacterium]|nr:hypothetical protein [Comamonadaceae bacterium]
MMRLQLASGTLAKTDELHGDWRSWRCRPVCPAEARAHRRPGLQGRRAGHRRRGARATSACATWRVKQQAEQTAAIGRPDRRGRRLPKEGDDLVKRRHRLRVDGRGRQGRRR